MGNGKIKDFLMASVEESVQGILESEIVPDAVNELIDVVASEGTSLFVGSIVGAILPRLNSIRLNYQEKRFEQRVNLALAEMKKSIDVIESRYMGLSEELQEKFRGLYVEWLMDNLYQEKQPEKVVHHVKGYINMMDSGTNDNIMLMFMETLNELTKLDIDVLNLYTIKPDESAWDLVGRYGIEVSQLSMIKDKLVRNGLLASKSDDIRDANIDAVVNYLMAVEKEQGKKNPKNVKLKDIKKPQRSNSYSITPLGRDFLLKIAANN